MNPLQIQRVFIYIRGMRKILTALLAVISFSMSAQGKKIVIDSSAIAFKAKMLTMSEYGIASKEDVIKYAENQKLTFLKTLYSNFLFMKVEFDQPYTSSDKSRSTLLRHCNYYLAYNTVSCRYYKLGGFDSVDIDIFFKDLGDKEVGYFKTLDGEHIEEIDIFCLYDYYQLSIKKRKKEGFHCFPVCSEETRLYYIEY